MFLYYYANLLKIVWVILIRSRLCKQTFYERHEKLSEKNNWKFRDTRIYHSISLHESQYNKIGYWSPEIFPFYCRTILTCKNGKRSVNI